MAEGQNVCSENKEIRETMRQMRVVNKGIRKVDAKALVTGRAVYTNDIASSDSLIVKLVRSPHAHALIKEINTTRAERSRELNVCLHIKTVRINVSRWQVRHILSQVRTTGLFLIRESGS